MALEIIECDVLIVGGGAAGLFCAIEAGKRGLKVVVAEKNPVPGRKILISGGGRCNFTNLEVNADNFVSQNPHFAKSALSAYTPREFISLVQKYRIDYYEKTLGQLFCRNRSREIVDMLLEECRLADVRILDSVEIEKIDSDFRTKASEFEIRPKKLVIASGGKSFPKIGATGFGYRIAHQFGLKIVDTRPSLVPLRFKEGNFSDLAGISIDSKGKTGKTTFRENILFTHKGLSGPLVLQLSNYWKPEKQVTFDLVPEVDIRQKLEESRNNKSTLAMFINDLLPKRFVETYFEPKNLGKRITEISKKEMELIAESLNNWQVYFDETEGWHKAEVTLGGVDTNELNSKTMEAKSVPNLFFIGEVVDVTGWLGGYNFQWAWSSGYVCGNSL